MEALSFAKQSKKLSRTFFLCIVLVPLLGSSIACESREQKLTKAVQVQQNNFYAQYGRFIPFSDENFKVIMLRIGAKPDEAAFVRTEMAKYSTNLPLPGQGAGGKDSQQGQREVDSWLEQQRIEREQREKERAIKEDQRRWNEERRRQDSSRPGNPYAQD